MNFIVPGTAVFICIFRKQIAVFKGIPYAKYDERFGDPEPYGDIWTGK